MSSESLEKQIYKNAAESFKAHPRQYPLPPFQTPFHIDVNPFYTTNKKDIDEWLAWFKDYSLIPSDKYDFLKDLVLMSTTFYPTCQELHRYENMVKMMIGFYVIDDHSETAWGDVYYDQKSVDTVYGQFNKILDKLISKEYVDLSGQKPYNMALFIILESICSTYNDEQKRRLVDTWAEYIEGNGLEQKVVINKKRIKSIQHYEDIRVKSIGVKPCVQFVEYAENICLTEAEWQDPRIQRLADLVSMNVVYVNDLYSFEKEIRQNPGHPERIFNLVAVIHLLEDCTVRTAMEKVVDKFEDNNRRITEVLTEIDNDPTTSKVMRQLAHKTVYIASGNYRTHSVMFRYNVPQEL